MLLVSPTAVFFICVIFKCNFSNIFLKSSFNFMLTKMITTICNKKFLTHQTNFIILSQLSVKISIVEIHTFQGLDILWKQLFILVPHSALAWPTDKRLIKNEKKMRIFLLKTDYFYPSAIHLSYILTIGQGPYLYVLDALASLVHITVTDSLKCQNQNRS